MARHTERLAEVVAFYRDGIGLREIGGFRDHDGYDGVFLDVPGTGAHLEFTAGGGHGAPAPHPESLLVLYLGDREAVRTVAARLDTDPVAPANPYWADRALTFEDPDGFRVVLVPEPWIENAVVPVRDATAAERTVLEALQRRSSDVWAAYRDQLAANPDAIALPSSFIRNGWVRVAVAGDGDPVGFSVVIPAAGSTTHELDGLFVEPRHMGRGIGRALVEDAAMRAVRDGATGLEVTAGPARGFYEKVGFVVVGEARTRFGPALRMRRDLRA